jgi:hypothetical protein
MTQIPVKKQKVDFFFVVLELKSWKIADPKRLEA